MFSNSVISRTKQMWMVWVGATAVLIGSIAPGFEQSGISWTAGTILAVAGYGIAVAFIRCPACGQRWLYKALFDAGLYGPLFRKPACPSCGKKFD